MSYVYTIIAMTNLQFLMTFVPQAPVGNASYRRKFTPPPNTVRFSLAALAIDRKLSPTGARYVLNWRFCIVNADISKPKSISYVITPDMTHI